MSQRYIVLKMASSRYLQEEHAHRHRFISAVDLRRLSTASSPLKAPLRSQSLGAHSNRIPSLRNYVVAKDSGDTAIHKRENVREDSHQDWLGQHSTSYDAADASLQEMGETQPLVAKVTSAKQVDGEMLAPVGYYTEGDEVDEENFVDGVEKGEMLVFDEGEYDIEESREGVRLPKEVMFVVAAVIVLVTSGGLILGFGPIYSALVQEKQWSELCSSDNRESQVDSNPSAVLCPAQEVRLQYVFSTSFLCLSAANAFFGVFLDIVGPRLTVLMGLLLSVIGNFALAYGDSHTGHGMWIIIGYSLLGAGGMGSYLASFQILQLYQVQGFVCSTLSSLFNCSGYIYMLLQFQGVTRMGFFRLYGILVVVCMLVCFLVFPTNNVTKPSNYAIIPGFRVEIPHINTPKGLLRGMKEEMKRIDLWYFAIYFGWISLIFAFAGGAMPSMLTMKAGDNTSATSLYTNFLYPVLVNGTFIYSPIVGYVIDHYGFKVIFAAGLTLVQLFIALLLVPSLHVQIMTFFAYAMAQACLYALQFAYIMICFPPELYGSLQAFMASISFAFGLFNYVLNPWTQMYLNGDYTIVLLALGLPTIPLYFFIDVVQGCEEITIEEDEENNSNSSLAR